MSKTNKSKNLSGLLYIKDIDKDMTLASDNCEILIKIQDIDKYEFYLEIDNISEDKKFQWNTQQFLIDNTFELATFSFEGKDCIEWFSKSCIYFLELAKDKHLDKKKKNFLILYSNCLYSYVKKINLRTLEYQENLVGYRNVGNLMNLKEFIEAECQKLKILISNNNTVNNEKEANLAQEVPVTNYLRKEDYDVLISCVGELFTYETSSESLVSLTNANTANKIDTLRVYKSKKIPFCYVLTVETSEGLLRSIDIISKDINNQMYFEDRISVIWVTSQCFAKKCTELLGFYTNDLEKGRELNKILTMAVYEESTKQKYEEIKPDDKAIMEKINMPEDIKANFDMYDTEDNEENEEIQQNLNELNKALSPDTNKPKEEKQSNIKSNKKFITMDFDDYKETKNEEPDDKMIEEDEDVNMEEDEDSNISMEIDHPKDKKESKKKKHILNKTNKRCLPSKTNEKCFCLTKDNHVILYEISNDNSLKKISTLPITVNEYKTKREKQKEAKNLDISSAQLFNDENNLIFIDKKNPFSIFQYDFNKEKVVQEWETDKKVNILDIAPEKINGEIANNLIYGVNNKSIFLMDSRLNNKNKLADIKTYTTNLMTDKIFVNEQSQFLTGSEKGEIRLYDAVGKVAKNLFSFYGDPVRSIDISSDKKFILLTFDSYLLLLSIDNKDQKNCFTNRIQLAERKTPIMLKIKNTDLIKFNLKKQKYSNAKFNSNQDILTSLGEYIIVWNFTDIKKGKIGSYKIKKLSDFVVESGYLNSNKILVTMSQKLGVQSQKQIFSGKKK